MTTQTFLFEPQGHKPTGRHASLAEASKALPDGAYTTLRTYGGRSVVRLAQHVARLNQTLALTGRGAEVAAEQVRQALRVVLEATHFGESRLRLTAVPPRLYVSIEPFVPVDPSLYATGIACVTLEMPRVNPHAKDTRFIATATSAYQALPAGVHEGLLADTDGALLEGLSSNFFAVRNGVLRTEAERALLGVTRSLALEVARELLPIDESAVTRSDIPALAEAFVTSVSRGILPVRTIDGTRIGATAPGPLTRELMQRFARLEAREAEML